MQIYLNKTFIFLLYLLPLSFILGPFIINLTLLLTLITFILKVFTCKDYFIFNNSYFKTSLIFIVYFSIITYLNNNIDYLIKTIGFTRFLMLPLIYYYFFSKINLDIKKLLVYFSGILTFVSVDLIIQRFFGKNLLGFEPSLYNQKFGFFERYGGIFNQELVAGGYLVFIGILSLILFLTNYKYTKKNITFFFIFFIISITGLLITGDRSPVLIILAFFILSLLFVKKIRNFIFLFFSILLFIFFLGINFSETIKHRFIDYPVKRFTVKAFSYTDEISLDKFDKKNIKNLLRNNPWGRHYLVSYEMIKSKPITGYGLKSFRIYCSDFNYALDYKVLINSKVEIMEYNACSTHPHNYFLEIISDTGIIGTILLIAIFLMNLRIAFNTSSNKTYVLMIFILMISILSPFKPSGSFFSTWSSTMIWYIFSLIHIFAKNNDNKIKN